MDATQQRCLPSALPSACRHLNTSSYCFSFSMIHTRNTRIRNLHASPLIKCPFRGCLRSFQSMSGRTQHINAQHHDRNSSPQHNSEPDKPGDASRSPSVNNPNTDYYPDASPPCTPSTPRQNELIPSPAQPDGFREPSTPTPIDPASSPIRSLLGSPFESVGSESPFQSQPDFDLDKDQMRSPSLFCFDSPRSPQSYTGTEAGPNADQGLRPHPHRLDSVGHDQDHQNAGPTVKTFHTTIDGATS
jgi:hypothetical protein